MREINRGFETDSAVNVRPYESKQSLPEGTFIPDEYDHQAKAAHLTLFEYLIVEAVKELEVSEFEVNKHFSTFELHYLFFEELSYQNESAYRVIEAILQRHPNLAWMRGGELTQAGSVATLDDIFGADGMIGVDVERWARQSYKGLPRKKPAIMFILLRDVLQAAKDGLFVVSTHHGYDVSLEASANQKKREELTNWFKQHLTVYAVR